jgi:hypothetical protein
MYFKLNFNTLVKYNIIYILDNFAIFEYSKYCFDFFLKNQKSTQICQ